MLSGIAYGLSVHSDPKGFQLQLFLAASSAGTYHFPWSVNTTCSGCPHHVVAKSFQGGIPSG